MTDRYVTTLQWVQKGLVQNIVYVVHVPCIRDTLSLAEFRCIAREDKVATRRDALIRNQLGRHEEWV